MTEIRHIRDHAELIEAVRLQKEIWGFADNELIPIRLFVVATKIGGQVMGAFDGKRMVAFLLAIPGIKTGGHCYLHSHMLGVIPEYHDRGIGRAMKLEQRREALSRGVVLIEWTFDPLELKNAFFNIERVGAIVRRFNPNQYGTTSSHLHGGLPTDRLVSEWHLSSPRAEAIAAGRLFERPPAEARISVPSDIAQIRSTDPASARQIQNEIRERFQESFAQGLAVTGFSASAANGTYLLGRWESE